MNYKVKIKMAAFRKDRLATLNGDLTVSGPALTLTGRDGKGEFEIELDDVNVAVSDIAFHAAEGDGWNEPRIPAHIEGYEIDGTDIVEYNEILKVYPATDDEEYITDPAQIKAIAQSYIDKIEESSDLSSALTERVEDAYEESRNPY